MEHIERFQKLKQELNDMKIRHNEVWYRYNMGEATLDKCKYKLEEATNKLETAQRKQQVARDKLEDATILLDYKKKLYTELKCHIKGLNTELEKMKEEMKEIAPMTEEEEKFKEELTHTDICPISDDERPKNKKQEDFNLEITDSEDDSESDEDEEEDDSSSSSSD